MKARAIITIIWLFLLFFLTVLSNPSEKDYISWLQTDLNESNHLPQTDLETEVFAPSFLEAETSSKNYFLYSIYHSKMPNGEKQKTLGLFNNFFVISKHE